MVQLKAAATHGLPYFVFTVVRVFLAADGVKFRDDLPTEKTEVFTMLEADNMLQSHPANRRLGSFHIGTHIGAANVVSDFELVPAWAAGTDLAAFVDVDASSSSFWLTATEPLILINASLELDRMAHANPVLHGPSVESLQRHGHFSFTVGKPTELDVWYRCITHGNVQITLVLEFEDLSPLRVPWSKTCGGFLNPAFQVAAGGPSYEEVVFRGEPRWDVSKIIPGDVSFTNFTLSLDPFSKVVSQDISKPNVKGQGSCRAHVPTSSNLEPHQSLIKVIASMPIVIGVEYACRAEGPCTVTMEVPFLPVNAPFRPVEWQWTKMCGRTPSGIYVEAGLKGMAPIIAANWHAPGSVFAHSLWLGQQLEQSGDKPIHIKGAQIRCLDSLRCSARFTSQPPLLLSGQKPEEMHVEYSCMSSGNSLVQLNLQTEGHDAVRVTWSKDCSVFSESLGGILIMSFVACSVMLLAVLGYNLSCGPQKKKNSVDQTCARSLIQFFVGDTVNEFVDTTASEFADLGSAHEALTRHERPAILRGSHEGGRVRRTLEVNRGIVKESEELASSAIREEKQDMDLVNAGLSDCLPCRVVGAVTFPCLENHRSLALWICHYLCWLAFVVGFVAFVGAVSSGDLLSYLAWARFDNSEGTAYSGATYICWDVPPPENWECEMWQDFECADHGGAGCHVCKVVSMEIYLAVLMSVFAFYTFHTNNDKRLHGQDSNWGKFCVCGAALFGGTNFLVSMIGYWRSCVGSGEAMSEKAQITAQAGPGLICITVAAGLKIIVGVMQLGIPVERHPEKVPVTPAEALHRIEASI